MISHVAFTDASKANYSCEVLVNFYMAMDVSTGKVTTHIVQSQCIQENTLFYAAMASTVTSETASRN